MPMPGVFSAINTRLQGNLVGHKLKTLSEKLPEGLVVNQEGWVESKVVPGTDLYLKGKYDLLVKNDDSTYTLVDLKISQPNDDKVAKYKTQLGAYKFALENPAQGKPIKITKLGLLIFYPEKARFENGDAVLVFPPKWLEVPIDDNGFIKFAREINLLLEGPTPPEGKTCKWCRYRHLGDEIAHEPEQTDIPF